MKHKLLAIILILVALVLFSIANRGAYKNYFQADSIDNIALMRQLGYDDLFHPLVIPKVFFNNFRPVGMLFFKLMGGLFGLWFQPYVAAIQILHIINVALLVWFMRQLRIPFIAACAGALFFAFHMAAFQLYWEPMYVFDLICASLCLLSLIAYIDGRWIVSFLLFWLAYRAKENAIMLPAVLALWNRPPGLFRQLRRLIPFFALSLILGVQALMNNAVRNSVYTMQFDPVSIWTCIAFYAAALLLIPYAGFPALAAPILVRTRQMWFGFATFIIFLAPMLLLPGRLSNAYLYVPLIGCAICIAALAEWKPKPVIAILLAIWIPWNFINLRWLRKAELTRADSARLYVANIIKAVEKYPQIHSFVYHDTPMEWYVIPAVAGVLNPRPEKANVLDVSSPDAPKLMQSEPVILFDWQPIPTPGSLVTLPRTRETPDTSYIVFDRRTPLWQLERGWNLGARGPYRWAAPVATARLTRPANAKQFELIANITSAYLNYVHQGHIQVSLNGHAIGDHTFDHPGLQTIRWNLEKAEPGPTEVKLEAQPGFRTTPTGDLLGLSIGNFGFITE